MHIDEAEGCGVYICTKDESEISAFTQYKEFEKEVSDCIVGFNDVRAFYGIVCKSNMICKDTEGADIFIFAKEADDSYLIEEINHNTEIDSAKNSIAMSSRASTCITNMVRDNDISITDIMILYGHEIQLNFSVCDSDINFNNFEKYAIYCEEIIRQ